MTFVLFASIHLPKLPVAQVIKQVFLKRSENEALMTFKLNNIQLLLLIINNGTLK